LTQQKSPHQRAFLLPEKFNWGQININLVI
jgi:hypothetical protein